MARLDGQRLVATIFDASAAAHFAPVGAETALFRMTINDFSEVAQQGGYARTAFSWALDAHGFEVAGLNDGKMHFGVTVCY